MLECFQPSLEIFLIKNKNAKYIHGCEIYTENRIKPLCYVTEIYNRIDKTDKMAQQEYRK